MNTQQSPQWFPSFLIPFFTLSYPTVTPAAPDSFPDSSYYNNGPLDICLVVSFISAMAILRDLLRLFVLEPFARWKLTRDLRISKGAKVALANGDGKANGVANRNGIANGVLDGNGKANGVANGNGHAVYANGNGHNLYTSGVRISRKEAKKMHRSILRFAEQGWPILYYSCLWSLGLYIHHNFPTRILNPIDVWLNYPHIPLAAPVKFYYLLQTAFYCHQVLILNAEARRKDHWQMMTHHVITIVLLVGSYHYNCSRVGCLVMTIMDWCDIFLCLAKMLRYLSFSTLCDATFVWFLASWAVTRHALFIIVIKSTWSAQYIIPWLDTNRGYSMTREIYYVFFSMLVMLQVIQIMWFWMICRVAWKVVSGQGAEDSRSDEEGGDSEEEKKDQ